MIEEKIALETGDKLAYIVLDFNAEMEERAPSAFKCMPAKKNQLKAMKDLLRRRRHLNQKVMKTC